jgi:hypothetical protein
VRAPQILFINAGNADHRPDVAIAAKPRDQRAQQHADVDPVCLCSARPPVDLHAGGVDHQTFNAARLEKPRQPEGIVTGQPRPCAICGLQPMSATSWSSAAGAWATSIWRHSASTCARAGVRAPKEAGATTTPSTAPGSFADTSSRAACASRLTRPRHMSSPLGRRLQSVAAQASRGVRGHHQALRSRRRRYVDGTRRGSDGLGSGCRSQLLHGTREQVRERHDRPIWPCAAPRASRCRTRSTC